MVRDTGPQHRRPLDLACKIVIDKLPFVDVGMRGHDDRLPTKLREVLRELQDSEHSPASAGREVVGDNDDPARHAARQSNLSVVSG